MIDKSILQNLTIDDLPPGYPKEIAEAVGLEAFMGMLEHFSGENIYIPKNALAPFKSRMALELKNQHTPKELGRMLDLSERHIYGIFRGNGVTLREQLELFVKRENTGGTK